MFTKILVANRGEIAVRIMATCREMGIQTVAVYSEADRHAMHVREADEAYAIGPAPAAQSYLRIEAILDAAKKSGAEAIHPGYGFLSENATFVEACEAAGIAFIGPPASAIRLMGSKIAAKLLAQSVNAPTIPGYNGESQDDQALLDEAQRIGFPLLIKASAGGGGKGMREVHKVEDFLEQLAGARRESLAAFGDGTVFLERLLLQPRHVEIQVLGDSAGNIIYLGERECSIQRRHQKIVEESPSVALTPALRAQMGEAAVRIAKAAGYVNAGTLEFMLNTDRQFYFLEMNTRLQVEHPVTELVTGLDLVRHQILIATGQPLGLRQEQIMPRGHAIEMRLYAEDPAQNFLPSTGTVSHFIKPMGPGIRVDSGIESGDEISQYYDPMLAKLIVYGEDRPSAIARMQIALQQSTVFGVKTNVSLLQAIATHPAFQEGQTFTSFLNEHAVIESMATANKETPPLEVLIAAALHDSTRTTATSRKNGNPWKTLGPWRMVGERRLVTYHYKGREYKVALKFLQNNVVNVQVDTLPSEGIRYTTGIEGLFLIQYGAKQVQLYVTLQENQRSTEVFWHGQYYSLERRQALDVDTVARGGGNIHTQKTLTAPMAGTIVKVQAQNGDMVQPHQVLVILSAMKMEHTITAPYEGKIRHIHYKEGDVVKGGSVIVEME